MLRVFHLPWSLTSSGVAPAAIAQVTPRLLNDLSETLSMQSPAAANMASMFCFPVVKAIPFLPSAVQLVFFFRIVQLSRDESPLAILNWKPHHVKYCRTMVTGFTVESFGAKKVVCPLWNC